MFNAFAVVISATLNVLVAFEVPITVVYLLLLKLPYVYPVITLVKPVNL